MWKRLAEMIVRRPMRVLIASTVLIAGLSVGLVGLGFRTDQDTLVDASSTVYKDNVAYQAKFGGESMLVLASGDPITLFSEANLPKLRQLEADLRSTVGVAGVVGPYSSLEYAAAQLAVAPELLGQAAARADDPEAYGAALGGEIQRLGAAGAQDLTNPAFVRFLVEAGDGTVRDAQRTAFPDLEHALLIVQLTGNASIADQGVAAAAITEVVNGYSFEDHELLVAGSPVLLDEINDYLQGGMASLGAVALLVMLGILALAFRVRWRLLPIAVMAGGTAAALGAAVMLGIHLSLVTISGLPIFIGLGVDFAIQMQNRYVEQRAEGDTSADAARTSMRAMAAPLTVAMVAGACGFLALRLSPVPMIRDFGLLLCLGVVILVLAAIVLPLTVLVLVDRHRPPLPRVDRSPGLVERTIAWMSSLGPTAVRGVLVVGAVVAAAGFVAEGSTPIDTEVEHWVADDSDSVADLTELRAATGFSTQLGIMVTAPDVTSDEVVTWMHEFQAAQLAEHPDELVQAVSITAIAADVVSIAPTGNDARVLLDVASPELAASLVTPDRRVANIQFAIGDLSLDAQKELTESIEQDLRGSLAPPEGVTATPSGLAVIGVELVKGMEANRQTLTLAALGLVALWLLVHGRMRLRAVLPVVPVAIAVGLANVVMWALGFELTPLTTVAGPLVIAVATEFTVLLQARYLEERAKGLTPEEASAVLPRIGRAFVASGLTLAGGFAVMAVSPMTLLSDFGAVVAVDVVIALVSALVLMPPLLRLTDRPNAAPSAEVPVVPDVPEAPAVGEHPPRRRQLVAQR